VITEVFVLDIGNWAGLYVYPLIAHVLDCVYVAVQHGAPVKHRSATAAPSTMWKCMGADLAGMKAVRFVPLAQKCCGQAPAWCMIHNGDDKPSFSRTPG
jgi:purine nucleoside phosphorylase